MGLLEGMCGVTFIGPVSLIRTAKQFSSVRVLKIIGEERVFGASVL